MVANKRKRRATKLPKKKKAKRSDSDSESSDESSASAESEDTHWSEYWKWVGKPQKKTKNTKKYLDAKWYNEDTSKWEKVSAGSCVQINTSDDPDGAGSIARLVELMEDSRYGNPSLTVEWFWRPDEISNKCKKTAKCDDRELLQDGDRKYAKKNVDVATITDIVEVCLGQGDYLAKKANAKKGKQKQLKHRFENDLVYWCNRTYFHKKKKVGKPDRPELSAHASPVFARKSTRSGRVRKAPNNVRFNTKRKRGQDRLPARPAITALPTACATRQSSPITSPHQPPSKKRKTNSMGLDAQELKNKLRELPRQKKGTKGNWDRNVFLDAKAKLKLSCVPDKLPCREKEHKQIHSFITNAIKRGGSGSGLYVAGMPGTGKTATVRQIIRELSGKVDAGDFPPFQYCEINAMKLPTPYHCYSELYFKLKNERVSHNTAVKKLEKRFSTHSNNRKVAVVLLDELDYLVTKKQTVIYNMFDWPTRRHGRMVMIGIANTMDLPERLTQRVQSRLGKRRITFAPYNRGQLETIIKHRLEGLNLFKEAAITFCASKVAGVSGDVRRALQIAKRAAEIVEKRYNENPSGPIRITIADINEATKSLYSSSDVQLLKNLRLYERMFMVAMVNHTRGTGRQEAAIDDLEVRMKRGLHIKGIKEISEVQLNRIMERLHEVRLINLQRSRIAPPQIRLNVQIDDINFSFKNCKNCVELLQTMA